MRELVFELDYDPGWNPVADTLAANDDAEIKSLSCHVTTETLWRVDHIHGSPSALTALEAAYTTADYFPDCLVTDDCQSNAETRALDRTEHSLIMYCVWHRSPICTSVPHLALEHLGGGVLFETRQQNRQQLWRIIHPGEDGVGKFTDALTAELEEIGGMELLRLSEHNPGNGNPSAESDLSTEQRRALHAAVRHGYYETPRGIELTALAEKLDIPQSTLSYRLQRAESQLATQFVESDRSIDSLSPH